MPESEVVKNYYSHRTYHLWAVAGGQPFEVIRDGTPLDGIEDFALSPDGLSIVATLPVPEVPKAWETLYPPPNPASITRIHEGHGTARQYVRIELKTGRVHPLTGAPTGFSGGWDAFSGPDYGSPHWSSDGRSILLPDTFIKRNDNASSHPCVAVMGLPAGPITCVEVLTSRTEEGHHTIWAIDLSPDGQQVVVRFGSGWVPTEATEYRRSSDGSWQIERHIEGNPALGNNGLEVTIKQSINDPPLLVASRGEASRVIWDPNPQLHSVELGEAVPYTWKDKDGRQVHGGLYKPVHYQQGQRYPLVIQTHGFIGTTAFDPSGTGFPNEFAARQLSSAGFLVLQAEDDAPGCAQGSTPQEGLCAASSYEGAAKQLVADGLADPNNIGLIGFSRSCWYVMEALTKTSYPFTAALIGDGVVYGYLQFIIDPSPGETTSEIGAAPFGEGLQKWLKESPEFNLDKVKTPLMVVNHGPAGLLGNGIWEPYAGLYSMKKPVDFVMLKTNEHVVSNPVERIASQTLSVDWFRFWLQGYEDPDPGKADQYKRWRELKKLQAENEN
jgi:dipeptidyl aminopeptidase/acylaminoacyl peptidase